MILRCLFYRFEHPIFPIVVEKVSERARFDLPSERVDVV